MIDRLFYAAAIVAASAAVALVVAEQVQVGAARDRVIQAPIQPVGQAAPAVIELERVVIRPTAAQRLAALQPAVPQRDVN